MKTLHGHLLPLEEFGQVVKTQVEYVGKITKEEFVENPR